MYSSSCWDKLVYSFFLILLVRMCISKGKCSWLVQMSFVSFFLLCCVLVYHGYTNANICFGLWGLEENIFTTIKSLLHKIHLGFY